MRRVATATAVVLLAASGCGSDDEENTAAGGSGGETIEIALSDFKLEPSTVTVETAGTYTFRPVNNGEVEHALEIEGEGVEEETEDLEPGELGEVTVELEAGEYELYCPIDGHREHGMEGTLVVGGGAGGTDGDTNETETDAGGY